MQNANWDDIRFFLAVAREGSITKAARELGVNYTTVARRISAFEERLQVRLFERLPGGFVLTAPAEAIFDKALAMEARAIEVDRSLYGHDTRLAGRLRLATNTPIAVKLLLPHLGEFTRAHPGIELEVATSNHLVDLDLREADVALRLSESPPEHLIGRRLATVAFGIYASPEYLARHRRLNDPAARALTWISTKGTPAWVERHFPKAAVGPRFDSVTTLVTALKQELGIALLPRFYGDSEPGLERIRRVHWHSDCALWILHHPDLRSTARLLVLREFVGEVLRARREEIECGQGRRSAA